MEQQITDLSQVDPTTVADPGLRQAIINAQAKLKTGNQAGMMGFGDIKTNPAANQAAQDIAGTTDDALGGVLMAGGGTNIAASGHGVMSPFEAAANGLKTAVGMGMIGSNMKAKKNAIKNLLRSKDTPDTGITDQDFSAGDAMTTPLSDA